MHLFSRLAAGMLTCAAMAAVSCEKAQTPVQGGATLEIYLTDAPGNYKAVRLDIRQLLVTVSSEGPADSGWTEMPLSRAGVYDLMGFSGGRDTLLASQSLPQGTVSEMRLVPGTGSEVVLTDGSTQALDIPLSLETGFDVPVQAQLTTGSSVRLVVDIDVSRSVVETPTGYRFNPVIRTYEKGSGGTLEGTVLPDSAAATVRAVSGTDTVEALPDTTGLFRIAGLAPGSYQVFFLAAPASGYLNDTLSDQTVTAGAVTSLDSVVLAPADSLIQP